MTKKELLENYRLLVIEIETLDRQSKFLNQYIGGPQPVRAIRLTGMPHGTNDPEAAILQQEDNGEDAIFAIEKKCAELRELVRDFERIMETIPDKMDQLIIRDYYALGMTDPQIARKFSLDHSTVWKRRTRVMSSLDD